MRQETRQGDVKSLSSQPDYFQAEKTALISSVF